MKKILLFVAMFNGLACLAGGDDDYAVSKIVPTLTKDADVVVRRKEQRYELRSIDRAIEYYKVVYTIFNENGDDYATVAVPYDKFNSIDYLEGNLYDQNGKKIKSIKKGDISDLSGNSEFADDSRYKEFSFHYKVYPYTVEFEYSIVRKETMFFPKWYAQAAENCAVESSVYTVTVPSDYKLRYKSFNYKGEPSVKENGGKKIYQWIAQGIPALKFKWGFPGWKYVAPIVFTAPSEFEIEDYKGSMLSWEELGKFQWALNNGRDQLPAELKTKVHQLTDGKSIEEKISILYDYLQKNTRYVSIQLGVGGWRPFEAAEVAKRGYGDCKGLSNYMYSLLKEAGVKSHYTLVKAGDDEDDILTDFPSRQFNHVILCVPLQKDTVWLECTSQNAVLGFMGKWTGNRHALLITEEGGQLVSTKSYTSADNTQTRQITAKLNLDGSLSFQSNTDFAGTEQEDYHDLISANLSKEKMNTYLQNQIDLATFDILKYEYKEERSRNPKVNEKLDVRISNYGQVTGKRIFINPNILNRVASKLAMEERTYPIWLKNTYLHYDSVVVEIPEGYKPEAIPAKTEIASPFGTYQVNYKIDGNKIFYSRRMERKNGFFKQETYPDLVKFYEQIFKADRARVVLVKNE